MNEDAKRTPQFICDEFGYYLGTTDDPLKETLRGIKGIPDATYVVRGEKVFVFDKLVGLTKERLRNTDAETISEIALLSIEDCYVSAEEAVKRWNVTPVEHKVEYGEDHQGRPVAKILHTELNAWLPGEFRSKEEVMSALSVRLLGGKIPGEGTFTYKGQAMTPRNPEDFERTPEKPKGFPSGGLSAQGCSILKLEGYHPGLDLLSQTLFNELTLLQSEYDHVRTQIENLIKVGREEILSMTPKLRIELLNDPDNEVAEYAKEETAGLRPFYPELGFLSDGSLFSHFNEFQADFRYSTSWDPYYDEAFLFYLVGKASDKSLDAETAASVGQWVVYAMLNGNSIEKAIVFGRQSERYAQDLLGQANRILRAIRFLKCDDKDSAPTGKPVRTMADILKMARSLSPASVEV